MVESFRNDYEKLLSFGLRIGAVAIAPMGAAPDCNNWRFYTCGAACLLTVPATPIFLGCVALCAANFCD